MRLPYRVERRLAPADAGGVGGKPHVCWRRHRPFPTCSYLRVDRTQPAPATCKLLRLRSSDFIEGWYNPGDIRPWTTSPRSAMNSGTQPWHEAQAVHRPRKRGTPLTVAHHVVFWKTDALPSDLWRSFPCGVLAQASPSSAALAWQASAVAPVLQTAAAVLSRCWRGREAQVLALELETEVRAWPQGAQQGRVRGHQRGVACQT
jgi:hypothetical protein